MIRSQYKATATLLFLIWLVLGCNFSDIPEKNRQLAKIITMNGDEIKTDHGRFVANTNFQEGDDCWIVKDAEGYFCLCTVDDHHTCYDVIRPGSDAVHPHNKFR